MVYRAIFFDYGGLLARCVLTPETVLRAHTKAQGALRSEGVDIALDELVASFSRSIDNYRRARNELREWTLYEIIKNTLPHVPEPVLRIVTDVYRRYDHDSFVYEDVKEVLPVLATEHDLGIVSDCPHDSLRDDLAEAGVLGVFKTLTFSHEVGYRKPHPKIYLTALERAQVVSGDSLFVSHDKTDLEGAQNVGMHVLLIDRDAGESLWKTKEVLR
ncbi:HAD family hydrolase [Candidatus Woesearchaeota archaeon]|nr:HAD family hydrolase [Candidatus Woesearchaeota archaeon]